MDMEVTTMRIEPHFDEKTASQGGKYTTKHPKAIACIYIVANYKVALDSKLVSVNASMRKELRAMGSQFEEPPDIIRTC